MSGTFTGPVHAHLDAFLQQKRAVGFSYQHQTYILQAFDRFCATHYPDAHTLTRTLGSTGRSGSRGSPSIPWQAGSPRFGSSRTTSMAEGSRPREDLHGPRSSRSSGLDG